jgi:hypothetical protein
MKQKEAYATLSSYTGKNLREPDKEREAKKRKKAARKALRELEKATRENAQTLQEKAEEIRERRARLKGKGKKKDAELYPEIIEERKKTKKEEKKRAKAEGKAAAEALLKGHVEVDGMNWPIPQAYMSLKAGKTTETMRITLQWKGARVTSAGTATLGMPANNKTLWKVIKAALKPAIHGLGKV